MKIVRFSQKGLVGCWRFDEETGSTAKDSSPYGNHGTIYGATRVRGIIGKALSFDGVDDYVDCGNKPIYNFTEFSVAIWINGKILPSDLGHSLSFIGRGYDSSNYEGWDLNWWTNDYIYFTVGNGSTFQEPRFLFQKTNEWHHIVGTYDGTTIKLFLDGEFKDSKTLTGFKNKDASLFVGRSYRTYYFNGLIDEVRIYNRALSPGEIKIIYAFTKYIKPHPIIMRRKL